MGGVWAGGPGPDLSQSLAFLARGRSPESGVCAILPLVVVGVVVALLGLWLWLGLIALRPPPPRGFRCHCGCRDLPVCGEEFNLWLACLLL